MTSIRKCKLSLLKVNYQNKKRENKCLDIINLWTRNFFFFLILQCRQPAGDGKYALFDKLV